MILSVLGFLWKRQNNGHPMKMKDLVKSSSSLNPSGLRKIVDILLQNNLIQGTANGELVVSGNLYSMTLYDLYTIVPPWFSCDENGLQISESKTVDLSTINKNVTECLKSSMSTSLVTLLEDSYHHQL